MKGLLILANRKSFSKEFNCEKPTVYYGISSKQEFYHIFRADITDPGFIADRFMEGTITQISKQTSAHELKNWDSNPVNMLKTVCLGLWSQVMYFSQKAGKIPAKSISANNNLWTVNWSYRTRIFPSILS